MPKPSPARKYLERYAAPEAAAIEATVASLDATYDHAIAIPLKAEQPSFLAGLAPALDGAGRVLVIAVINAAATDPERVHLSNEALARALMDQTRTRRAIAENLELLELDTGLELLLVDRFRSGRRLDPGQGVGLARKIGCDLALALRDQGKLRSRWLHTTDADATLPAGYFRAGAPTEAAGLVYPFWHETSPDPTGVALALYEISLRYYVLGLRSTGSPYAFHTLGSAMAAEADAYAAVRGVPRREAAEDFYLLGKLAKLGPIARAPTSPIRLRQRLSDRVPFGTGPATRQIAATLAAGDDLHFYDPRVFEVVARALRAVGRFAESRDPIELTRRAEARDAHDEAYGRALEAIGAPVAFEQAAAATTSIAALTRRLHGWLDGFRTLKMIHAARDAGLVNSPWRVALARAPFLEGRLDPDAAVETIRRALAELEQHMVSARG
jgi:hypothetical protein